MKAVGLFIPAARGHELHVISTLWKTYKLLHTHTMVAKSEGCLQLRQLQTSLSDSLVGQHLNNVIQMPPLGLCAAAAHL